MSEEYVLTRNVQVARELFGKDQVRYHNRLEEALRALSAFYIVVSKNCPNDAYLAETEHRPGLLQTAESLIKEALKIARDVSSPSDIVKNLCALVSCHIVGCQIGIVADELAELLTLGRQQMIQDVQLCPWIANVLEEYGHSCHNTEQAERACKEAQDIRARCTGDSAGWRNSDVILPLHDVAVVYWGPTRDVACIVKDELHKNGCTVEFWNGAERCSHAVDDHVSVVVAVVAGGCAKGTRFGEVDVISVWPNNLPQPVGLTESFATLDMIGTDFELSLQKVCEHFPLSLRAKNSWIRSDMKNNRWAEILERHPELSDLCPFDKLTGNDWVSLILLQPQFVEKCVWAKLSGSDWVWLLSEKPEYAAQADWGTLDGGGWARLIEKRPEFSKYCDWSKIKKCYDWVDILKVLPECADKCDFGKFDGYRWVELLIVQPQFVDRCDWKKLDGKNWVELLPKRPEFSDQCNWRSLDGEDWVNLLLEIPSSADKCVWTKLTGSDWEKLLCKEPQFAKFCNWKKLNGDNWCCLLKNRPEFAEHCDWRMINGDAWTGLLCSRPEFADKCEWQKLDPNNWAWLLEREPQFADRCDWSKVQGMSPTSWTGLLYKHPEFSSKCDAAHVNWQRVDAMVTQNHDIAMRCDWRRLTFKTTLNALMTFPDCIEKVDFGRFNSEQQAQLRAAVGIPSPVLRQGATQADVYICSISTGREAARKLATALEKRQYAVYLDENVTFTDQDKTAIDAAKYFFLMRSEGLFDAIIAEHFPEARQLAYAIETGKRIISAGPSDQHWQDKRQLPEKFRSIEMDQVKNLDMGDLFEEKVDALIRESMKGERGSLSKQYDVFISYRRDTGAQSARRIQQALKDLGYIVFLDYDSILNGKYDKVIESAIRSAPVFLMLLSEKSLDRCSDEGDWVASEIRMARSAGKCVIPVLPDNQNWRYPKQLPPDLDWIKSVRKTHLATDEAEFGKSVMKLTMKFPKAVKDKANEIAAAIRNPGDLRTIGKAHDTALTNVLKKWPDAINLFQFREFDGGTWKLVLCAAPELASICDWSKLCHHELMDLLIERPELAGYCDFTCFEGWNWECLLREHPEFANRCEWYKFTGEDWNCLYRDNPSLAEKYEDHRDWAEMSGSEWRVLLKGRPQFADRCDWWKLDGDDLCQLLKSQPSLVKMCPLDRMSGSDWINLLTEQPLLACYCHDWVKLDGECWAALLRECPWFSDKCDWFKLTQSDWETLLASQPQFVDKCSIDFMDQDTLDEIRAFADKHTHSDDENLGEETDGDAQVEKLALIEDFSDRIVGCDYDEADVEEVCSDSDEGFVSIQCVMKGRRRFICAYVDLTLDDSIVSDVHAVSIHDISDVQADSDYSAAPEVEDLHEIKYVLDQIADKFHGGTDDDDDEGSGFHFVSIPHSSDQRI